MQGWQRRADVRLHRVVKSDVAGIQVAAVSGLDDALPANLPWSHEVAPALLVQPAVVWGPPEDFLAFF